MIEEPVIVYTTSARPSVAERRVRKALHDEGFSVITEFNVQAMLMEEFDVEFGVYKILGVGNPSLVHGALRFTPTVGAFLPWGVALYVTGLGTCIVLQNPLATVEMFDLPEIKEVAQEAYERLTTALNAVGNRKSSAAP